MDERELYRALEEAVAARLVVDEASSSSVTISARADRLRPSRPAEPAPSTPSRCGHLEEAAPGHARQGRLPAT
jgi:hypothetical protein